MTPPVVPEPTLLELLEEFAQACESGDWGHLDEEAADLRRRAAKLAAGGCWCGRLCHAVANGTPTKEPTRP